MNLLYSKSFDDLDAATNLYFDNNNISRSKGSIAKLLLNIINKNTSELYQCLTINHVLAFLSTAEGDSIDEIGYMLNCKRLDKEDDDDYKYRISKWIENTASSNQTAIRLAVLSIDEVQDCVMKPYPYGPGSYSILVLTEDPVASIAVLSQVRSAVDEVSGFGIRYEVVNPDIKYVKIKVKLLLKDTLANGGSETVLYKVHDALKTYLLSIPIGESMIPNEITQRIMEVDDDIVNYTCEEIRIDGKMVSFITQECRWNERFMLSLESDAVIVE